MLVTTVIALILTCTHLVNSCEILNRTQFLQEQNKLYRALMQDYVPKLSAIPAIDRSSKQVADDIPRYKVLPTLVYLQLMTVVESAQKVDITMEYKMGWTDERLSWNPADYCGINEIYLSREDVWVPVASLVSVQFTTDFREDFQKFVWMNSSGYVEFFRPTVTSLTCKIGIRQFPFDSQNCSIVMMAQSLSVRDYTMETDILPEIFSNIGLLGNGEWQVRNLSLRSEEIEHGAKYFAEVKYIDILMTRSPSFYVTIIITPSFIINVLCILGLFLKSDRTTKLGMALTNIMSLTFVLGILAAVLPKSNEIPKIGVFVVVNLALMVASLGLVLLLPYIRLPPTLFINSKVGHDEKKPAIGGADGSAENTKEIAPLLNVTLLILLELANLTNFLVLIL